LKKDYAFAALFAMLLLGLAFAQIFLASPLSEQQVSSHDKASYLGNLAPVFPFDDVTSFSKILFPEDASGSSVVINSSSLALGVYGSDPRSGVPQPLGSIDWSFEGPIVPGQNRSSPVVYLRNEGNSLVNLYLSTAEWVFRDSKGNSIDGDYRQFFSLSWDYDYSGIAVEEVRPVVFTLTVWPGLSDVSTFSFDLVVTLTG
jgi:hypothetical protein